MSLDDTSPFQVNQTETKPSGSRESLEYMRAVNYVFESPKWFANLLWGSLCLISTQIIPVVGQLVWVGYQFEIVEELLCRPPRKGYQDFDANRFKDYLMRVLF